MSVREMSLRVQVEKWLGLASARSARVTRSSYARQKQWRYVCVETNRPCGTYSIIFFRHDDGSWCVFPPDRKQPALSVARHLAPSAAFGTTMGTILAAAA